MKVFLDDLRNPADGWEIARNAQECVAMLMTGRVTTLSLDHDLGEGPTGNDVLKWIEQTVSESPDFKVPTIFIHTSNTVGRQNMINTLKSINKIINERKTDEIMEETPAEPTPTES